MIESKRYLEKLISIKSRKAELCVRLFAILHSVDVYFYWVQYLISCNLFIVHMFIFLVGTLLFFVII